LAGAKKNIRNYMKFLLSILPFIGVLGCSSSTTTSFEAVGTVVDKNTKSPVDNAAVSLCWMDKCSGTRTSSNGSFKIFLSIFPDSSEGADMSIRKDGYKNYSETVHGYFLYDLFDSRSDTFFLEKIDSTNKN
jgi:hypothetical protein